MDVCVLDFSVRHKIGITLILTGVLKLNQASNE